MMYDRCFSISLIMKELIEGNFYLCRFSESRSSSGSTPSVRPFFCPSVYNFGVPSWCNM